MQIRKKIGFATVGLILRAIGAFAQQDAQYTQYMYNTAAINPAYVGSREALSITGLSRTQWVGLEGAPKAMTLAVSSPVSEKVGLGLSVIHNQTGPSNETLLSADISYNIRLSYAYWLFRTKSECCFIEWLIIQNYSSIMPMIRL